MVKQFNFDINEKIYYIDENDLNSPIKSGIVLSIEIDRLKRIFYHLSIFDSMHFKLVEEKNAYKTFKEAKQNLEMIIFNLKEEKE